MVVAHSPTSFSLRKLTLLTLQRDRKIKLTRLKTLLDYHQHIVCFVMLWDQVFKGLRKKKTTVYHRVLNQLVH